MLLKWVDTGLHRVATAYISGAPHISIRGKDKYRGFTGVLKQKGIPG